MQAGGNVQRQQGDVIKQAQGIGGFNPFGIGCCDRLIEANAEQAINNQAETVTAGLGGAMRRKFGGAIGDVGVQNATGS